MAMKGLGNRAVELTAGI